MSDVYQRLAQHLDKLPAGFPATESGVELRILKRMFSEKEARTALCLTMMPEAVESIAERGGQDAADLAAHLDEMAAKGLIYRAEKHGRIFYMAAQFVIGIWEHHVNDLDQGLIRDFNEYIPYLTDHMTAQKTQQLRVIPISQSIEAGMEVMPYEAAEDIVKSQSKILVAPCICRREHKMMGKGCDKPEETCLIFGGGAYYYEKNKLGRFIDQEEALGLLKEAEKHGLVLQPSNSQKPVNICMCCGCCCQILKNMKKLDKPARHVNTSHVAEVNPEDCVACEVCVDRCQVDAITVEDTAVVDLDRCIGCGLCVSTCETGALKLVAKPESERWTPPANVVQTYMNIARERGLFG